MQPSSPNLPGVHTLEDARVVIKALWEIAQGVSTLQAQVTHLAAENTALTARVQELEQENAALRADNDKTNPPSWVKPDRKKRRRRKTGAKKGHKPAKRTCPEFPDQEPDYPLDDCPECQGPLGDFVDIKTHTDIEIPTVKPIIRKHTFYRYWCPCCKRLVRTKTAPVVPRSLYGPRFHAFVAWCKFGLGLTLGKIQALLSERYEMQVSTGVLSEMLSRTGKRLKAAYDALVASLAQQAVLYADESGWRVEGKNHYLWVFTNDDVAVFHIDRSRGSQVLVEILGSTFDGVLCSDFYSAYNVLGGPKQKCLVHFLRDLRTLREKDESSEAQAFSRALIAVFKGVFSLHRRRSDVSIAAFQKQYKRLRTRLLNLARAYRNSEHADCQRLAKRVLKHRQELLVCLEVEGVEPGNNFAEQQVRPAVLMRKTSYGNRSERGQRVQEIVMSLIQTCRKRSVDFVEWATEALTAPEPPPLPQRVPG